MSSARMGKRRAAVLAVLVSHGRSTGRDIVTVARRDHGVSLSFDGALDQALALEDAGLAEKADPHLDRFGRLRSTWKATEAAQVAQGARNR